MTISPNNQDNTGKTMKHEIRVSDLPGEIREIAKLIGLNSAMKLARIYGGDFVYIPKYESITRPVRDRAILAEYNGQNLKELAIKFNLSIRYVRTIIENTQKLEKTTLLGGLLNERND